MDDKSTSNLSIAQNLEFLVKSHISQIDKLTEEQRNVNDMLYSILENDSTFKEHEKLAKEAAKVKSGTKQQLLKTQQAANLAKKLKELKTQNKEHKDTLSTYLQDYQRTTGASEIDTGSGIHQIIYVAKLVRK